MAHTALDGPGDVLADPVDVAALVQARPTQNEAVGEAHLALAGKALHAHS